MLPTSFSPKAFPKALQPNCTGVFSVSIGLLNKSHGIEPHQLQSRRNHNFFPANDQPHQPLELQARDQTPSEVISLR
jgi:hypothetical protein